MIPSDVDGDDVVVFWLVLVFHDKALLIVWVRTASSRARGKAARIWWIGIDATRRMKIKKHSRLLL
tara:strand:+ start:303 stop:500 length:198 start_codon:yes stop_codon:yes gene_type:complete